MGEFHFVKDYVRSVRGFMRRLPRDQAMSEAIGGKYEEFGAVIADAMIDLGVRSGQNIVDLGCGSGRVAVGLSKRVDIQYLGTDIVDELLVYARTRCPQHYKFVNHRQLSLPVQNNSIDVLIATSVFTHLLHEETFIYLRDAARALKSGGRIIMSFLEFTSPNHWTVFEDMIRNKEFSNHVPLNMFIEQSAIVKWAEVLGLKIERFKHGLEEPFCFGQSVAVLTKP